jgi:hypothetical protein
MHGYKMSAGGKVVFYSRVARNSGFISVLAHPWGVVVKTSALSIAELICQSPLLRIFAEYALHDITILDSTAMFAWLDLWIWLRWSWSLQCQDHQSGCAREIAHHCIVQERGVPRRHCRDSARTG